MEKNKESKSVFVIVREYPSVKLRLWERARDHGFFDLSTYVRSLWDDLL